MSLYSFLSKEARDRLDKPSGYFRDTVKVRVFEALCAKSKRFILAEHADFTSRHFEQFQEHTTGYQLFSMIELCANWEILYVTDIYSGAPQLGISPSCVASKTNASCAGLSMNVASVNPAGILTSIPKSEMPVVTGSKFFEPTLGPVTMGGNACDDLCTDNDLDDLLEPSVAVKDDKPVVSGGVCAPFTFMSMYNRLAGSVCAAVRGVIDDFTRSGMDGKAISVPLLLLYSFFAFGVVLISLVACMCMVLLVSIVADSLAKIPATVSLVSAAPSLLLPAAETHYRPLVSNQQLMKTRAVVTRGFKNVTLSFATLKASSALGGKTGSYMALSWEKLTEIRMHALEIKINSTEDGLAALKKEVSQGRLDLEVRFLNISRTTSHLDNLTCSIRDRVNALELNLHDMQSSNLTTVDGQVVQFLDVTQIPEYKKLSDEHAVLWEHYRELETRLKLVEDRKCVTPESLDEIRKQMDSLTHPEWALQQIRLTAGYQVHIMVGYTLLGGSTLVLAIIQAANRAQSMGVPVSVGGILSMMWTFVTTTLESLTVT